MNKAKCSKKLIRSNIARVIIVFMLGAHLFLCPIGVRASEVDLMSVLRITLANQADIKLGELDVEQAGGDLQAAAGQIHGIGVAASGQLQ